MKLNFIKVNPTENMTVFITDTIPRALYRETAKKIMDYKHLHAEQVGFIEKPTHHSSRACMRLHMMGDEFCVNATRALAAILVHRQHPGVKKIEKGYEVALEVSGTDDIIHCKVEPTEDSESFISTAEVSLHKTIEKVSIEFKGKTFYGSLVTFPGITHLVIEDNGIDEKEEFFQRVKEDFSNLQYEALGVMFYNRNSSYMMPLVYVKGTDSLFWERGCGSGTSAVGVVLSHERKEAVDIVVLQPGGGLQVLTKWVDDGITNIFLKGSIEIVAEGTVYI